ncbi:N-6 DNA methylase [Brachyspira pilosicoli]|uniref:N-6 DNA methylase n=1 Tax=Brachyspira pilosicoli TaxID=52584 RepID=UPI003004D68C
MNIDFDYKNVTISFENSLNKEYKKEYGVFYTDIELSKNIISFLNIPKKSIIFDPCCGLGAFLFSAINLGYNNIYGADIDKKAVNLCKKVIRNDNIFHIDTIFTPVEYILKFLKLKDKKIDYICGNPPYGKISKNIDVYADDYLFVRNVKDSGSNLFVAALYKAFELVKKDGYISYIIPKNFLHVPSYSIVRKMILKQKTIMSIIDIGAYFKNVKGEQIIINLKNKYSNNNVIDFYTYKNNTFFKRTSISQDFFNNEILFFNNDNDFRLYNIFENSYKKFSDICSGYIGRGKDNTKESISGKQIKKFGFKNIDVPKTGNKVFIQNIYSAESGIIASFAGNLLASQTVTVFTDGDEKMCHYIVGILHSRLCNYYLLKFCFNNSKYTMHTDAKYLRKIPLEIKKNTFMQIVHLVKALGSIEYMSEDWFDMLESLNDLIYKTYDISNADISYIDKEIKEIQSKRWKNEKM